ncbi:hypothetical protein J3E68DRAFT_264095 [Trichoderma sp. SZMC 28012]
MTPSLSSLYPEAKVVNLLALGSHDIPNATFLRFIKYCDTDDSIIGIAEVVCRQHNHFIWCYDRPKAECLASTEGRVVLSGLHLPDEFDEDLISKFEPLFGFLNELQMYEFDGCGENGVVVIALESKFLNGKAWYREDERYIEDERRSLMVSLWDVLGWIAQHLGLGACMGHG